ncbi:MAG: hypothetical protein RL722_287 [Pseudomonadota bacterium]|jgi:HD-like signal output (HDOD) protein
MDASLRALRDLQVELPPCPRSLAQLLPLLDDDRAGMAEMATVVETDMALAAAVVRTVNSAMFGLLRRVDTVAEAMRHLGTREVAALTYATALRGALPSTPALDHLWDHAARAGLLMGRSAPALGLDPWRAHTAGLFAWSGLAVLLAHRPRQMTPLYLGAFQARALPASAPPQGADAASAAPGDGLPRDEPGLILAEQQAYGFDHAALGSALCAAWGLSHEVVHFVHDRLQPVEGVATRPETLRRLLCLGRAVDRLLTGDALTAVCRELAPGSGWPQQQLEAALAAALGRGLGVA